ncbi:MAG: hypothetical protein ATN35_09040 [Epulopiscium sp. Nele67-Bin004]|nr:MAG: hypothetical protein ATN35_09040 [Epulopiscium sp. Nele67-Bin004]
MEDKLQQQLIECLNKEIGGGGRLLDKAKVQHKLQECNLTDQTLEIRGYQFIEGTPVTEYVHYMVLSNKTTTKIYKVNIVNRTDVTAQLEIDSNIDKCGYEINLNIKELKDTFEEGFYEIGILTCIKDKGEFAYTDTEVKLYITPTKITKINSHKYYSYFMYDRINIDREKADAYMQLVEEFGKYIEIPDKLPVYTEGPPKIIWVCWLQGIENAPPVVKACYNNLMKRYPDYKKVLITADNYTDYVEMDSIIVEKWKKGIISNTMFSDVLRLELLVKYGGIWIDSTILCTTEKMPSYIEDSPLFMYRYRLADARPTENSLIGSCKDHVILRVQRDLLIKYWHTRDDLINYSMLNMFFKMLSDNIYSYLWEQVPYLSNGQMLMSYQFLSQEYNEKQWKLLMESSPFYKLTYKLSDEVLNSTNTYYAHIIKTYS